MARVTVEDCIINIPNRFDLVITSAQRAKQIASGSPLTVDRDNDKNAVVSLREIAEETIDVSMVQEELIQSFQKQYQFDRSDSQSPESGAPGQKEQGVEEAFSDAEQLMQEDMRQNYAGSLSFIEDNVEVDD